MDGKLEANIMAMPPKEQRLPYELTDSEISYIRIALAQHCRTLDEGKFPSDTQQRRRLQALASRLEQQRRIHRAANRTS